MRRIASHTLHIAADIVLGAAGIALLGGLALAFRLHQGPIDVTRVAQTAVARFVPTQSHITLGAAQLAYEGFSSAGLPLDFRIQDVRITAPGGTGLLTVPHARITLSLRQLLLLRVVPRSIEIDGAAIALTRDAAGNIQLAAIPQPLTTTTPAPATAAPPTAPNDIAAIFSELSKPARSGENLSVLSELKRVRITDCTVTITDQASAATWSAPGTTIDFSRAPLGGVTGYADLNINVGATHIPARLTADLDDQGTHVTAGLGPITPAALVATAKLPPVFAFLDAPITLNADLTADSSLHPKKFRLDIAAGPGTIRLPTSQNPDAKISISRAYAAIHGTPTAVTLSSFELDPTPAHPGARAPIFRATASLQPAATAGYDIAADVSFDQLPFTDVGSYWPAGVGGGTRPWVVENITGGRIHDANFHATALLPPDLSAPAITSLTGTMFADNVDLFWLKPVPKITAPTVKLTFDTPDQLHIDIQAALQTLSESPTPDSPALALSDGRVIITGLSSKDQFLAVTAKVAGNLTDAVGLLSHPRLHLLSSHPLDFPIGAGNFTGSLAVKLPLKVSLTIDDVAIIGDVQAQSVRLSKVALGRDLENAEIKLHTTNAGLSLNGTGDYAKLKTNFSMRMEFHDGPVGQIEEQINVKTDLTPAAASMFGLPDGVFLAGTAPVALTYTMPRAIPSVLAAAADLSPASIAIPLGWSKKIGDSGRADVRLTLSNGRIFTVDRFSISAPNLAIDGASPGPSAAGATINFSRADIGGTHATGTITLPPTPKDPYILNFAGPSLDLEAIFKKQKTDEGTDADDIRPGPIYQADLAFDTVDLMKGISVKSLKLHARNDGLRTTDADIFARGAGDIHLRIAHTTQGRALTVTTNDAGTTLLALNITSDIRGGSLNLSGLYDDKLLPPTLNGTADLKTFAVLDAPAIGKLMQAMTLYGVSDLLKGNGLNFSQAIVPFALTGRHLVLKNARAFSSSLGLTGQGKIDLRHNTIDIAGTVVPAYFFNQLLGDIPLLGRIFSPEKGGGVFAASYTLRGPLAAPKTAINPLSALTPGFLRGVFGIVH